MTVAAATHCLTLPGPMLRRGFWLYVWRVEDSTGQEWLYVGRTGDNSSPNASDPFTRVARHLGENGAANMLRRHLKERGVPLHTCHHHLTFHGPIHPEVERPDCPDQRKNRRNELMGHHRPLRDEVGAYERDLAAALADAGYSVLNTVKCKWEGKPERWQEIRAAFAEHFPNLAKQS